MNERLHCFLYVVCLSVQTVAQQHVSGNWMNLWSLFLHWCQIWSHSCRISSWNEAETAVFFQNSLFGGAVVKWQWYYNRERLLLILTCTFQEDFNPEFTMNIEGFIFAGLKVTFMDVSLGCVALNIVWLGLNLSPLFLSLCRRFMSWLSEEETQKHNRGSERFNAGQRCPFGSFSPHAWIFLIQSLSLLSNTEVCVC